jgi:hypothetical protein
VRKKLSLMLYRMPDQPGTTPTGEATLLVSFVLVLDGGNGPVPLIKSTEARPYTPWSPDDVACPDDVNSLVLSLEKALGIYCGWADIREARKRTRIKVPGLNLRH